MADPIDRQELRKAMYHEAFETDSDEQRWDSGCWIRYKMFERILGSMPPAQPERKKGKWVHGREIAREMIGDCTTAVFYEDWKCSGCGCVVEEEREPLWNFCPNCGADMRTPTQVQLDEADDVMMGGDNGKTD